MPETTLLPIDEVARNTGVTKDTLRVWERRYGFPLPDRGDQGERRYTLQQVDRLHRIRRLLDLGYRPGKVVALQDKELLLLTEQARARQRSENQPPEVDTLVKLLHSSRGERFEHALIEQARKHEPDVLISQIIAPLVRNLGEAWAYDEMPVFIEHHATQAIIRVLSLQLANMPLSQGTSTVLLTTVPGERHYIGVMMAETLMRFHGLATLNLGTETPLAEIPQAVSHYNVDALALSFSQHQSRGVIVDTLEHLSQQLPRKIKIVAGGFDLAHFRRLPRRVEVLTLEQLPEWSRQLRGGNPSSRQET